MNKHPLLALIAAASLLCGGCAAPSSPPAPAEGASPVASGAPAAPSGVPSVAPRVSLTNYNDPSGLVFPVPAGLKQAQHVIDLPAPLGYPKRTKTSSVVLIRDGAPPMTLGFTALPASGLERLLTVEGAQPFFSALMASVAVPNLMKDNPVVETVRGVKMVHLTATAITSREGKTWNVQFVVAFMRAPNGRGLLFNAAAATEGGTPGVETILRSMRFDPKAVVPEKPPRSDKK